MTSKEILDRLKEHSEKIFNQYPKEQILGIFLYGSQNYGISTENSDIDTKAIYIPTIEELCLKEPISESVKINETDICDVKDIREIVTCFKKQNINYIEILFTPYFYLNPKYQNIWKNYFIKNRERIAKLDKNKAISSMCGQLLHSLHSYDNKKVANCLRIYHTLIKYAAGDIDYWNCINLDSEENKEMKEKILSYKNNEIQFNEDELETLLNKIRTFRDEQMSKNYQKDYNCIKIMEEAIIKLITYKE